jgi:hypothetical protein
MMQPMIAKYDGLYDYLVHGGAVAQLGERLVRNVAVVININYIHHGKQTINGGNQYV